MSALFDAGQAPAKPRANDDPHRPTGEQIRLLADTWGYRPEAVRTWTKSKADSVIQSHRKQDAATTRRAMSEAEKQDGKQVRGQPAIPERMEVAAYLDEIAAAGPDEWCAALSYSMHALTDDELGRLRGHLVKLLRGNP